MKISSFRVRGALLFGVFLLLLLGIGGLDLFVLQPQRMAREKMARREAAPKLVRPSQRLDGESERRVITAFRADEWQLELVGEPEDVYLSGYLEVQAAEAAFGSGDLEVALNLFEGADREFARIARARPDFEPEMLAFRRTKIAEAIARIKRGELEFEFVPRDFDGAEPPALPESRMVLAEPLGGGDPADHYLKGYLLVQEAETQLEQGNLGAAKAKFAAAALIFEGLSAGMPSFEPDMVSFRSRKIEASLAELEKALLKPGAPQSSIGGVDGEMQIAGK